MALSVLAQRDQLGVQPGRLFIDGIWGDASDGGTWEQRNPATNEVVTTFAVGSAADVDNSMAVARDEVFGPVLVVMPFDDEAHAIALANDTEYGLGAGVYTTNIARALRVARGIRAGTIGINEYTVWSSAPFGGYEQSGLGREGGWGSIEAFTETKSVIVGLSG